jgi:DNA-binding transcriptional ArsR family regulator
VLVQARAEPVQRLVELNSAGRLQRQEALQRLAKGEESMVEIARSYDVSHPTISRLYHSRPF